MSRRWIVLGIILLLVVGTAGMGVGTYNRLVQHHESIRASWSQVENVLQRRYDLIPNLVNTVKGYAAHERGVFEEVTRLRSQWGLAKTVEEKIETSERLESALGRLMVIVERYPDLKANQNFLALQDEMAGTENRIAVERRRYNEVVMNYNILVRGFPSNLVARLTGFQPTEAYFKAAAEAARAPQVQF